MRNRIVVRLITAVLMATALGIPAIAPAAAAITPLTRTSADMQSWNIMRLGDANGDVIVPDVQKQVVLTGFYKLQQSFISTLVVGDVIGVTFTYEGGYSDVRDGAWYWQISGPPDMSAFGKRGMTWQVTALDNNVSKFTYFTGGDTIMVDGSGELKVKAHMWLNGEELTGATSDYFVDFKPQISWAAFEKEYTVTAQDTEIIAQAPLCLDRTKFNGSGLGSLTRSLGLQRNGSAVTGNSNYNFADYVYRDWENISAYGAPLPSDTFWLNTYPNQIKPNSVSSNVVAGDVLTMNPSLTHSTIGDVLGTCPRLATSDFVWNKTQFTSTYDVTQFQVYCEVTDLADGSTLYSYQYENYLYQGCRGDGMELGHTYRVVARMLRYGDIRPNYGGSLHLTLGTVISIEDSEITVTRDTYTEPTLPGNSGPGAVVWQSKDNPTDTTPYVFGRGNSMLGQGGSSSYSSDGTDGTLITSRPTIDTIRVERWGIDGRKQIGGQDYVDFTDPVPTGSLSTRVYQSGIGWYGNKDSWFNLGWGVHDAYVTEGTFAGTTTDSYKIPMSSMDAVCRDFNGDDSSVSSSDNWSPMWAAAMGTATPSFRIFCLPADPNHTGVRRALDDTLYVSVDTVVDGVATLKVLVNASKSTDGVFYESNNSSFVANEKPNLAPTDIAMAFITARKASGDGCVSWQSACPWTKLSLTLVKADGSVVAIEDTGFTGPAGRGTAGFSIAFDGNGKLYMSWTSTATNSFVSQHYWELYQISNAGAITKVSDIAVPEDVAYEGVYRGTANPDANDTSVLFLANGVGDDTKLYARRVSNSITAYSVINLETDSLWSGEAVTLSVGGMTTFDNSGHMYLYSKVKNDSHYSVIRWGVGVDPTDGPSITSSDEVTVERGNTTVLTATSTLTSPTWSITSGNNGSLFNINASTGAITFKTAQPVGDYVVNIKAVVGGEEVTQTLTVHVTDTTDPTFELPTTVDVDLNNDVDLAPSNASESGTYTLSGDDAELFNVNSTTGRISFKSNPTVTGTYNVTLTLTDGSGNETSHSTEITVVPDTTAPELETSASQTVVVGDTSIITLEANETVIWELDGGANGDLFEVDSETGALTFKAAQPVGSYEVRVKMTDLAGNSSWSTITVVVRAAGVAAPSPATFQVQPNGKTKITWKRPDGAIKYNVKRNGKIVCKSVTDRYCVVPTTFKKTDKVRVTAVDAQGRTATATASFVATGGNGGSDKLTMTVFFAIDDWHFSKEARGKLYAYMLKLKSGGYSAIKITAYTDDLGNMRSDTTLSLARAKNVKRYLMHYLPSLKVEIAGLGREHPAVPNTSETNRQRNRRAVVQATR